MPLEGFESTILVFEQEREFQASYHATTVIGTNIEEDIK
jgi:hypothetical protein